MADKIHNKKVPNGTLPAPTPLKFEELKNIESYFRSSNETLPSLDFSDKDGDDRIDLFDRFGNELSVQYRETSREWAHLLRSLATNFQESDNIELSVEDWEYQTKPHGASGKFVLPNGLQIIVANNPDLKLVWGALTSFVGGTDETREQKGISHLLEHVVGGSGPLGDGRQTEKIFASFGGQFFNAYTNWDRTSYLFRVIPENADKAYFAVETNYLNRKYNPRLLEIERTQVVPAEISMEESKPSFQAYNLFLQGLFPDHPVSEDTAGTAKTIGSLRLKDLTDHHCNFYVPNNSAVVLAGPITLNKAISIVRKGLLSHTPPSIVNRPAINLNHTPVPSYSIVKSGTDGVIETKHTTIKFGYRLTSFTERDLIALKLITRILRDRFRNILKYGTALAIHTDIDIEEAMGVGILSITLELNDPSVKDALILAHYLIAQLGLYPPNSEILEGHKKKLIANELYNNQSGMGLLFKTADEARFSNPVERNQTITNDISSITPEDISKTVKKYFSDDDSHTLIILGKDTNMESIAPFEKIYGEIKQMRTTDISDYKYNTKHLPFDFIFKVSNGKKVNIIPDQTPTELKGGRFQYKLANGITVIMVPEEQQDVTAIKIRSPYGYDNDPKGKEGLSAILKNILFLEGTSKFSGGDFDEMMNFLGAEFDASGDNESTSVSLNGLTETFPYALNLLLYNLSHPIFSSKAITDTKSNLENGRLLGVSDPSFLTANIPELVYMKLSPWSGCQNTLENISFHDISSFWQKVFDPSALEVTITGNQKNLNLLNDALSSLSDFKLAAKVPVLPIQNPNLNCTDPYDVDLRKISSKEAISNLGLEEQAVTVLHTPKKTAGSSIVMLSQGPARSSLEYPYYMAFIHLLGDRLEKRLRAGDLKRDKGGDTHVYYSNFSSTFYRMNSPAWTKFEFDSAPSDIGRVIKLYNKELTKMKSDGKPSQDELSEVISKIKISDLAGLDTVEGKIEESIVIDHYPVYFQNSDGSIEAANSFEEQNNLYMKLPINDVLDIGGKYFGPEQETFAYIVGP